MRYVVQCDKCTGPDLACDELTEGLRCSKCGSAPSTYLADGACWCWLHRERMTSQYPVHPFFLTTVYVWRGQSHLFPNARLFDGGTDEGVFAMCPYCESCQKLYAAFLNL